MNGLMVVAEAIGVMGKANTEAQTTTAIQLLTLMGSYVPLTTSWSTQLRTDEETYFAASMGIASNNPQQAAVVAADYATYLTDSTTMTKETGDLSTTIQNEKAEVRLEGNSMTQVFNFADPLAGIEKMSVQLILASNF